MHGSLDPTHLAKTFGYIGILSIIFLESGVVFGFFLPGDSLLFAAGLLASQGYFNVAAITMLAIFGAILGNNVGYYTGKKAGPTLFNRPDSKFFSKKRVAKAHEFFERRGGESLILARFIPAGRTFVPIMAGVAKMNWRHFFMYNSLGALLWGISLPVLGYTLGKHVSNIDSYILPIVGLVIIISTLPVVIHYQKSRKRQS